MPIAGIGCDDMAYGDVLNCFYELFDDHLY